MVCHAEMFLPSFPGCKGLMSAWSRGLLVGRHIGRSDSDKSSPPKSCQLLLSRCAVEKKRAEVCSCVEVQVPKNKGVVLHPLLSKPFALNHEEFDAFTSKPI